MDNITLFNSELSYSNVELSLSTMPQSYLMSYSNDDKLNTNSLVISLLDDRMYYGKSYFPKYSYQKNNLFFIDNEKNIIPMSYNVHFQDHLNVLNNKINLKIDNSTIFDAIGYISADKSKIHRVGNEIGIFRPDYSSLVMNKDNQLTISNDFLNIINNSKSNAAEFKRLTKNYQTRIDEATSHGFYRYFTRYKGSSCSMKTKSVKFKDERKFNEINNNDKNYIDYNCTWFKIFASFEYDYYSTNIVSIIPFDFNDVIISTPNVFSINPEKSYMMNHRIKETSKEAQNSSNGDNQDKAFIYKITGTFDYVFHFNVLKDNYTNNDYKNNYYCYDNNSKITLSYNGDSVTMDLYRMIDNDSKNNLYDILYHDYNCGFNTDGNGQKIGLCCIPKNFYSNIEDMKTCVKPTYIYLNGNNKFNFNLAKTLELMNSSSISTQLLQVFSSGSYYIITGDGNTKTGNEMIGIGIKKIINPINKHYTPSGNGYLYKKFIEPTSDGISTAASDYKGHVKYNSNTRKFEFNDIQGITKPYNTKLLQTQNNFKYSKECFNEIYNIFGSGLRYGDVYVPSLSELISAYSFRVFDLINVTSSHISIPGNNEYKTYFSSDIKRSGTIGSQTVELIGINTSGKINVELANELNNKSICTLPMFKIPDISILNGNNYQILYDDNDNCELIDYRMNFATNDIYLKVKRYYNNTSNIRFVSTTDGCYIYSYQFIDDTTLKIGVSNLDRLNMIYLCYEDSDVAFNTFQINNKRYRILCKINIKIKK